MSELDRTWHEATPTQQGLWILDRIERLRPSYLLPTVLEFDGRIDHTLLVAAVQRAVARHPALRSRFRLDAARRRVEYRTDGEPAEAGLIDAAEDGWSAEELADLVEVLCYTPFDLAEEAPARAEVIRVDAERTLLVLTVHHIVFDGVSRQLLMDEITQTYQALLRGHEPAPTEARHPAEVTSTTSPGELAELTEEVIDRLRGAPTEMELPYDHAPGTEELSMISRAVETSLDAELTAEVLAAAEREGCTVFMTGVALLAATLANLGKQREFLFGVVWPGRDDPAAAEVIGMFMTTLVIRADVEEAMTWRELLRSVRVSGMETFVAAEVPLNAVAAALDPDRDVSRHPVTPVLVNLSEVPKAVELAPGVTGRYRVLDPQYTKYDLALFVRLDEETGALELSFDYMTDLFTEAGATALLTALRRSAAALAHSPEDPVLKPAEEELNLDDPAVRVELVRSVWREALGIEEFGDDANFFEVGGDSLRLVVLVERLSQLSGKALKTVDLFRAGTVRGQAELLTASAAPVSAGRSGSSRDRLLSAARARRGGGPA